MRRIARQVLAEPLTHFLIIGALLVIGAVAFYANESGMFAGKSSSGPSVTVNTPSAPSAPAAPSAPRAPATTGSGGAINR